MRTILLALVCTSLSAQYSSVQVYSQIPSFYAATMSNMVPLWKQQALVAVYRKANTGSRTSGAAASAAPPVLRPPADFRFPYQKRLTSVDEFAGYLASSPAERKQVASELAVLIEAVADDLKQDGSPYDVAKAFTFFTATMYSIVHPEVSIDEQAMSRLLRQFRSELLDEASLKASPVDRTQRQWESLISIGGLVLMGYERASQSRDETALKSLRASAALGLTQLFRIDSTRLHLDPRAVLPLSISEQPTAGSTAPAAAQASGWGAPSAKQAAPPAPAAMATPAPSSTSVVRDGAIAVGHYHMVGGVHPAELRLLPDGLSFDPLGNPCNQPPLKAPYSDVRANGPASNGNSEILLNLRVKDPRNPKKTLNFNFATADSWNDNSSGVAMVRSPDGAMGVLKQLADTLRSRGAE